jgi:RND family efflux transporter MFP subunit
MYGKDDYLEIRSWNAARTGTFRQWSRAAVRLSLLTVLVLTLACGERNTYAPPPPPKVTVSRPVQQPVTDYLEFTGNTAAFNKVQLRARVEGYLEKVLFQDGDLVKKGQLLFLIQQNTYEAKLKQAESEVLSNKARLWHAETEFVRFSGLVKEKAAAQTEEDKWRYERDASRAAVVASEASVVLARLNLSYTRVTAPFDGRIDRRLKDPGNLVGGGEPTLLAEVNQIDPIYVYFNISEHDLLRVRGQTKESEAAEKKWPVYMGLANESGYPRQGHLDFAAITLNPTTGTLLLRGVFPNPKYAILPGLFARVRAPLDAARPALLIPEVAIGYDQMGPYVLVVDDKNVVERRGVKLGPQSDDRRVVTEGLKGDEWVVVNGQLQAIPGKQVNPEKEAQPGSGGPKAPAAPKPETQKAAP